MPKGLAKTAKAKRPVRKAAVSAVGRVVAKGNKKGTAKYQDIRRILQKQRAALLEEAGAVLTSRASLQAFPDVSDQASAEMDHNFTIRLKEREQRLLKKIDDALDRIDARTYGICESCGQEIPYKRLKARPVTTLCIECKTQQEIEEKIRQ
jgi:DnaK suppressor protein